MASTTLQDTTQKFVVDQENKSQNATRETDAHRLEQRLRQITYGKNTLGYAEYLKTVPKNKRKRAKKGEDNPHPVTPDIQQICSKRGFDGQVKKWRRQLHLWDPKPEEDEIKIEVEAEYAEEPTDVRHNRRLGTPLRDDSLDQDHLVLEERLEEPLQKPSSRSSARVPSTGSKRDTVSGSLGQAAEATLTNATSKRQRLDWAAEDPLKVEADSIYDDWE